MKRLVVAVVLVVAFMFSLSTSAVLAQEIDYCEGDFDYDGDCDGTDAARFKQDFGRSVFENPCPPNGPAPVPKTGQTTSFATGDDGDLEEGVVWPNPRFTDNLDGTVTDNLTGLIWLKDAGNCFGRRRWNDALSDCNGLASGSCGLTDGSSAGDWRLSNRNELESLVHNEYYLPVVPNTAGTGQWSAGDPFTNVKNDYYWSSSTNAQYTPSAWSVLMYDGSVNASYKGDYCDVWPVRDPL